MATQKQVDLIEKLLPQAYSEARIAEIRRVFGDFHQLPVKKASAMISKILEVLRRERLEAQAWCGGDCGIEEWML